MLEHIYGHSEMIRNDEQFAIVIINLYNYFNFYKLFHWNFG